MEGFGAHYINMCHETIHTLLENTQTLGKISINFPMVWSFL